MKCERGVGIALALVLGAAVGCGGKKQVSYQLTSCPPAPLEGQYEGKTCHDLACPYASPLGYDGKYAATIGCDYHAMGDCITDGKFMVGLTTQLCCPTKPSQVRWCGSDVKQGAACNAPDNSECVLPDQSATCACDKPGPIWRCLPLDGGVQYCSCQDLGNCLPDAGADADDAGAG